VLNEQGYNVIILQALDSVAKEVLNVQSLLEHRIAGVLACPMALSQDYNHYKLLVKYDIPLIFFDNTHINMPVSMVLNDDYKGAALAAEHLIDQGCSNIIFLAGPRNNYIYQRRYEGFRDTLQKHNIIFSDDQVFQNESDFISGRDAANRILARMPLPDGVFSVTDHQAIQLIQSLKIVGVKIPQQIAITGFSNAEITSIIDPPLTTIDQHSREMGSVAAKMLLEELEQRKKSAFIPKKIYLTPELIIRQSTLRRNE
jgi:LacI family transcriptional regulator